jgi:hypothetical protein
VHLGEFIWLIYIIRVAAAVGSVIIEGADGAGNASSIIGINADSDGGGGVNVVIA